MAELQGLASPHSRLFIVILRETGNGGNYHLSARNKLSCNTVGIVSMTVVETGVAFQAVFLLNRINRNLSTLLIQYCVFA